MNLYETTFIINPQTDDTTIDRHVREIASLITDNQGQIRYADHMGTRRLAYEIKGLTQGYYASFIFEAPTSVLPKLTRHFKLNEQYIRHLTVRFEGNLEKLLESTGDTAVRTGEGPAREAKPVADTRVAEESAEGSEPEETESDDVSDDTAKIATVGEPEEETPVEPKDDRDEHEL